MGLFKKLKSKLKKDKEKQKSASAKRQAKIDEYKETTSVSPITKHHTKKSVSTKTKGGDYKVYKKKSKTAKSFRQAFRDAKGKDFKWQGRAYSGKTADDVKKEKAAKSKKKQTSDMLKRHKEHTDEGKRQRKAAEAQPIVKSPQGAKEQPRETMYSKGGKVESNPYGWPTKDARGRK